MCVFVCVCVRVRERGRQCEHVQSAVYLAQHQLWDHLPSVSAVRVQRERLCPPGTEQAAIHRWDLHCVFAQAYEQQTVHRNFSDFTH